jgi:uncharacterized low-complexity protein
MALLHFTMSPAPAPLGHLMPALIILLASPFIVSAVLLSVVAVATLLRAPKNEAVRVLSIFASAICAPSRAHSGDQEGRSELDSDTGVGKAGHSNTTAGDVRREA